MTYTEQIRSDVLNYCWHHGIVVRDNSGESVNWLVNLLTKEDEVTGFKKGYTYDSLAMKYVLDNGTEIVTELCRNKSYSREEIIDHLFDFRYWDVQIRIYLLREVIEGLIDELIE